MESMEKVLAEIEARSRALTDPLHLLHFDIECIQTEINEQRIRWKNHQEGTPLSIKDKMKYMRELEAIE